jgi:uncharacterized protein YndB with AHSA1/START domain
MDRGLVLELSQIFRAPRGVVFRALSEPAMLTRWWGPAGFTTPQIAWDLGVGGRYRLGMQPPGAQLFHLAGEFLEIDPPRRLVYTFRWEEPDPDDRETVVALTLQPLDAATKLSLAQGEFASEARLALHRSGWSDSFEKLRALVESAAGSGSSREAPPAVQADASGDAPLHRP